MNLIEQAFGIAVLLLAATSVLLSLVVAIVWLWGNLRRLIVRGRPLSIEQEYRELARRQASGRP